MLKFFNTIILVISIISLYGQEITIYDYPRTGLMVSATGASIFMIGVSMKHVAARQYYGSIGSNYVQYDMTDSRRRTQLTILVSGAIFTVSGLIIENVRRNRKKK